ncbi:MAG: thioredoxin family protein [Sulfolobales archaeon]|nr:thioredoxin family protein [Sulfolobales archaeon]MCX8186367.1 thioredoxin family protein [Sulfolobales archaeon]MDW7968898.1 thioredoxin family protein [Sulfolobales archaeon]
MDYDVREMFEVRFTKEDLEAIRNALSDMKNPVDVLTFVGDICTFCSDTVKLVDLLASLSPEINGGKLIRHKIYHYKRDGAENFKKYGITRVPSIVLIDGQIRYTGMPAGEELRSFIETMLRISNGNSGLTEKVANLLSKVSGKVHMEVIVTPTCPYCPYAAFLTNMFAFEAHKSNNRNIVSDVVEAYENPDIADKYGIMSVPAIVINGEVEFVGVPDETELLSRIYEKVQKGFRPRYY